MNDPSACADSVLAHVASALNVDDSVLRAQLLALGWREPTGRAALGQQAAMQAELDRMYAEYRANCFCEAPSREQFLMEAEQQIATRTFDIAQAVISTGLSLDAESRLEQFLSLLSDPRVAAFALLQPQRAAARQLLAQLHLPPDETGSEPEGAHT